MFVVILASIIVSLLPLGYLLEENGGSGLADNRIHEQYLENTIISSPDYPLQNEYIGKENMTEPFCVQLYRSGQQRSFFNLLYLLCMTGTFFYCLHNGRMFFACIQSYTYLLARFLCELFTLKKKDGKKRAAALASAKLKQ